jgi:hypothetical protein
LPATHQYVHLPVIALARQHHQAIVSRDDHFDYVSDLRRVSW